MFPAVYNANFRIVQTPGAVAIVYELIHDTRVIRDRPVNATATAAALPDVRVHG